MRKTAKAPCRQVFCALISFPGVLGGLAFNKWFICVTSVNKKAPIHLEQGRVGVQSILAPHVVCVILALVLYAVGIKHFHENIVIGG